MTKAAIKQAFNKLDATDQARILGDLATALADSLACLDDQDAQVFRTRAKQEAHAVPLADVRRRLHKPRRGS